MNEKQIPTSMDEALFQGEHVNDWCAGCGDFGILRSLEKTLAGLGLQPDQVAVFGGIGCSGKTPYYLSCYGIHTLHGRVLPFATGAKLANPDLTVIAVGGDGDGLSIGAGHLVNAGRRNVDLTYIIFDNGVYGLTKGQASPTLRRGEQTRAMTSPNLQAHINPLSLALTAGFSWIGRGYAYDVGQLCMLMESAIRHPGSALLTVLQPCPTYNQLHDKDWYAGKDRDDSANRLYALQQEDYDPVVPVDATRELIDSKVQQCLLKAEQWDPCIPTGIFYQDLSKPCLDGTLIHGVTDYKPASPAQQPVCDTQGHPVVILDELFDNLSVRVRDDNN